MQNIIELQTVGSTNDHAISLAKNAYPHGTVVFAHAQTAGRGRQGNAWLSSPGNLFMSMILRPKVSAALAGQLSFLSALALAETLGEILPPTVNVALKWPNDLLLNEKKTAGILLETEVSGVRSLDWVVVGIGVNVATAPEGAACLKDFGVEIAARALLENLSARIVSLYDLWQKDGFAAVRDGWLGYAHNIGKEINVRLPRETFKGVFLGIDQSGSLQLKMQDDTVRQVASGDVFI